uniref:Uncharacterized protein n=1 Tax=Panagrolaimus sp. PS1159 TaxID=55785 RepID=A0AC35F072_9BILA
GYNICITICMIIRAKRHWHTRKTVKIYIKEISNEKVKIVLNSLGKAIPASDTLDSHFISLKTQWA